ncbi:MAG: oxygen-insensitive NADPH nitroreductase [Phycisphaerales bacterium JB040]
MSDATDPGVSNPTLETMLSHRSVRTYTDDPIPPEHVRRAVEAGQMAPTSSAVQAYSIIRITDPGTRARLAELTGPQEKVRLAPEFFVVCADSRRHRVICEHAGTGYDQRLEAFLVAAIDASLFAQNVLVAFESMGYGTCYIGGLRNDLGAVCELLDIPEGVYPLYGLCVGRPAEEPGQRPRLPVEAVLFDDAYPSDDEVLGRVGEYDEAYRAYLRDRGAPERGWSDVISGKYVKPIRPDLASVYLGRGARLD